MKAILSKYPIAILWMVALLPFIQPFHRMPITSFYSEWLALVLGVLVSTVLLIPTPVPFRWPKIAWLPLWLAMVIGLQMVLGHFVYWQQPLSAMLFLVWAAMLMQAGARLKQLYTLPSVCCVLAWGILSGGLISVFCVILQGAGLSFGGWVFPQKAPPYPANLAQVNHLNDYLALAIVSLLYLYSVRALSLRWVWVFIPGFLMAMMFTGSRMSWLYLVMIVAAAYGLNRGDTQALERWQKSWFWLMLPLYLLMQLALPEILSAFHGAALPLPETPTEKIISSAQTPSIRLELLQTAWQMFLLNPAMGAGWGQFAWHDFQLAQRFPYHHGITDHAHNLFAQVGAELGLAGLIPLVINVIYLARLLWRQRQTAEGGWMLLLLGVMLIHSLLEYPLWYAYFLGLFSLVCGMAEPSLHSEQRIRPWIGRVCGGVTVVLATLMLSMSWQHYRYLETWMAELLKANVVQKIQMLKSLSMLKQHSLMGLPMERILTRVYVRQMPEVMAPMAQKIHINARLVRYSPQHLDVFEHVILLAKTGQGTQAAQWLQSAMIRFPGDRKAFKQRLLRELPLNEAAFRPLLEQLETSIISSPRKVKPS